MLIIIRNQQTLNSLTIPKGPVNIKKQVFLMQVYEVCICGFQRLFTHYSTERWTINNLEV